jgi:glycosyltransferase involved in cell wall biosynthesis
MNKQNIRIIVTALVPKPVNRGGKTGGPERMTEILKRIGHSGEVEIILISSDNYYPEYFQKNGITFEFRPVRSNLKFKSFFGLGLKSLYIIAKSFLVLKFDFLESRDKKVAVYASSDLYWETIPAFLYKRKNKNIEWVQVIHHVYPDWKKRSGIMIINFFGYYLQRFSFWLIREKADKVIVLNDIVKADLLRQNFSGKKIFVSSNGIDLDYFEGIGEKEKIYDGVFLGRLSFSKGVKDLVEIWKNVCQDLPSAKLAIIGGGNEAIKSILLKMVKRYNLIENIDLLGFLDDNEAYPALKSGKVFIFPSHEEGWGIAIAEAMVCGLPVISWDLPVFRNVFGSQTIQIEESDINLFSRKIIELLKNDSLRQNIGARGKEYIKKYSWDEVARKEIEIISSK